MSGSMPDTLLGMAAAIREGKVSSTELTKAALDKAKAVQDELNAFVALEEDTALAAARKADALTASGAATGPFHGVPLAHKDMYDRKGFITGCASKIRADHVASETCTVLERLEQAGALQIGRLNMSEFALGPTGHNAHHGRARNPIDPDRITGGSSSGSGAAVGAGIVPAALGSDTGGSIRLPAACCGVVGLKPTQGRVSRHGVMPLSFSQDCVGPLARSVEDAYELLRVIAGPDGKDATCADAAPLGDLLSDLKPLKIGLPDGFFTADLDPQVASALETSLKALKSLGMAPVAAPLPDLSAIADLANVVAMTEGGAFHFDWLKERPEDYGPQVRMRLSQSLAVPGPIYLRAQQARGLMLQETLARTFGEADVLIAPVMPFLPPLSDDVDVGDRPEMASVIASMAKFTRPWSFLGLPAIALPVQKSSEGLPIAMQIVARPWREDLAASVAYHLERHLALGAFEPAACFRTAA